jgi:hypothetical protein
MFSAFNGDFCVFCGVWTLNLGGHSFKKIVADSNAHVQEKALDALIDYVQAVDADVGRWS